MLFGWILFFFIILFNSISEAFGKSFLKCYLIALCMFKMINNSFLSKHGRLTSEHIAKSHIPVSLPLSLSCSLLQSNAWWKCDAAGPCGLPCTKRLEGGAWMLTSSTVRSHWLSMTSLIRGCKERERSDSPLSLTLLYSRMQMQVKKASWIACDSFLTLRDSSELVAAKALGEIQNCLLHRRMVSLSPDPWMNWAFEERFLFLQNISQLMNAVDHSACKLCDCHAIVSETNYQC